MPDKIPATDLDNLKLTYSVSARLVVLHIPLQFSDLGIQGLASAVISTCLLYRS